uniref:Uncharacterized protein n=1 Tax=Lepeophtheirus salmonis TaxID=72036 RepID=A0A0K2VK90_LEPSM
MLCVIKKYLNH